jgi:Ni,Fe-hydrogenase I cytochrome b subunit
MTFTHWLTLICIVALLALGWLIASFIQELWKDIEQAKRDTEDELRHWKEDK